MGYVQAIDAHAYTNLQRVVSQIMIERLPVTFLPVYLAGSAVGSVLDKIPPSKRKSSSLTSHQRVSQAKTACEGLAKQRGINKPVLREALDIVQVM